MEDNDWEYQTEEELAKLDYKDLLNRVAWQETKLQQIREYCENGIIDINCGNIGTGSLRGQLKDILEILNSGGAE